ncbi:MAG: hypothetical protein WC457_01670 [Patescibacteria group bacterium]
MAKQQHNVYHIIRDLQNELDSLLDTIMEMLGRETLEDGKPYKNPGADLAIISETLRGMVGVLHGFNDDSQRRKALVSAAAARPTIPPDTTIPPPAQPGAKTIVEVGGQASRGDETQVIRGRGDTPPAHQAPRERRQTGLRDPVVSKHAGVYGVQTLQELLHK